MAQPPDVGETFLREVDENLRRDQMRDFFKAYGNWLIAGVVLFLAASSVVFLSALRHLIDMAFGDPQSSARATGDGNSAALIVVSAMGLLLLLGLWMPLWFSGALSSAGTGSVTSPSLLQPILLLRRQPTGTHSCKGYARSGTWRDRTSHLSTGPRTTNPSFS